MLLGLSLSHDASAVVTDTDGLLLSAIGEERISRVKNHVGIPINSIKLLGQKTEFDTIYIGSHELLSREAALNFAVEMEKNPSNPLGLHLSPYPGSVNFVNKFTHKSPHEILEFSILNILKDMGHTNRPNFKWVNHHKSHIGSALGTTHDVKSLLFSLDGQGDGESGMVAIHEPGSEIKVLARFPALDSLGELYSAVTRRYNFKASRHEGKITGLAAYGQNSLLVEDLLKYVEVKKGIPFVRIAGNEALKIIKRRSGSRFLNHLALDSNDLVNTVAVNSVSYADLAFAVQKVLELSVLEIINYWVEYTGVNNIALAGGVFSNVKLNQKISGLNKVKRVTVFPNMGDGGLSVGAIWFDLASKSKLKDTKLFENMYLAPIVGQEITNLKTEGLKFERLDDLDIYKRAASEIAEGKMVAVHHGAMEFGPRALGNRSILLDPRDAKINSVANRRLNRTEFMPFAPIVNEQNFYKYFQADGSTLQPFFYMTMTCNVKEEFRKQLPGITHIDHTARPQIVSSN
jgi:carbamoyltransferase